jgi:hypothetical protein
MCRVERPERHTVCRRHGRPAGIFAAGALAVVVAAGATPRLAGAAEAPVPGTTSWSLVHETGQAYCLAHAFFPRSRIALGFVSDGTRVGVALVHGGWRLREWQEYEVAFRFDDGPAVSARFVATDATSMAMELDPDAERDFRRSGVVQIAAFGALTGGRLSLTGSARAIDYVRTCGELAALHLEESNASIRD